MKHYCVFALVITIALAISVTLLPREQELRVMYLKGQRYEQARMEFENQVAKGDLSVSSVMPLVDLYTHFGQIDEAVALLERFTAQNPKNASALDMLARLYGDAMRPADQIRVMETLQALSPSAGRLKDLIALYRLHGPDDKLIAALEVLIEDRAAESEDIMQVAFHHARADRKARALEILSLPSGRMLSMDVEEMRASLMLDLGKADEARITAVNWLKSNYEAGSLERMLRLFKSAGHPQDALAVLKPFEEKVARNGDIMLLKAELELADGKLDSAVAQVRELGEKDAITSDEFAALMNRSLRSGQDDFARRLAAEAAPKNLGNVTLASIAETALKEGQPELMAPLLTQYGEQALASRPVLAGHLKRRLGGKESATPGKVAINWRDDLKTTLDLARWHADPGSKTQKGLPGRQAVVRALLALLDRDGLADSTRLDIYGALAQLGVTDPLLSRLEKPALERGGRWAALYEETLNGQGGEKGERRREIYQALKSSTPLATRRATARRLIDEQALDDAERILRALTETAGPESEDVLTLVSLWPRPLRPNNLAWLVDRARQSTGTAKAGWMHHLNQAGAANEVVRLVGDRPPEDGDVFHRYLEALATLRDGPRLARALDQRMNGPVKGERWQTYGAWAEGLDQFDTARAIFRKLLAAEPDVALPLRHLGVIAYHEGHWREVADTLGPYLAREEGDWQTNYYYAEANLFLGHSFEAEKHSLLALESISREQEPTLAMQVARAYCLKRLGRKEEAIVEFQALLERSAGDPQFRSGLLAALCELNGPKQAMQTDVKTPPERRIVR